MKKIGVLTYIREYANLGTNMQSYCTFMAVRKQFPNDRVELIDYSGWKPAMRPYLSQVSLRSLINDFVRIGKYKTFFRDQLVFGKEHLITADLPASLDFIRRQNYDAIFVGSDTLLELKRAGKDELTAYWLDDTIKAKKFLIAASSHNVTFEGLSEVQKQKMKETIDDYSLLGVRDEASFRLMSGFIPENDSRLQLVPDPTFTYDIDYSHIEKYLRKKKLNFKKPVVCLHLLRGTAWAAELASLFRKEGYLVASLRPAYYADIIFTDLAPFEQLGLYRYFDLVITHRFHDSIFSLKNLTPVLVFPEYNSDVTAFGENKNKTLFRSFDIEENYIADKENHTAQAFFQMHRKAIGNFKSKEAFIRSVLSKNKERYESYVKKAAALC